MPSVCKNSEKLNVAESDSSSTPYRACISALDKKIRNLEKRKSKLDGYREKLNKGEKLDKDQKEAVAKYESVIANLEFGRDLQKMYQTMSDEADKLAEKACKKQAKKEKLERQQQELDRLSDVLILQTLMLNVGSDEIRANLLSGKYGGVTLTEENLTQFDEFYQLIAPATDGETSFTTQLSTASEHLVSYIDKVDKQVVGTTYHDLHQLVDRLTTAGFFESSDAKVLTVEESGELVAEAGDESDSATKQDEAAESEGPQDEAASSTGSGSGVMVHADQVGEASYEVEGVTSQQSAATDPSSMTWYQSTSTAKASAAPAAEVMDNQNRFQRPLQEIVSSMQGSYNFLQDSEIDVEQSFERVNFIGQPEHSYTFVNQQMLQHGVTDLGQYGATSSATQPNGAFVSAHHHQVALQEPGFVVVGHDMTSGEMQYTYANNQPGFMSAASDVTGQQSKCVPQSVGDTAVKRAGGGDAQDTMMQATCHSTVPVLSADAHQGFEVAGSRGAVYGGGRGGGRGGAVYSARGGSSHAGNMPGGQGTSGARGGKCR